MLAADNSRKLLLVASTFDDELVSIYILIDLFRSLVYDKTHSMACRISRERFADIYPVNDKKVNR